MKKIDLTGNIYGKLKVTSMICDSSHKKMKAVCECLSCGKKDFVVNPYDLRSGKNQGKYGCHSCHSIHRRGKNAVQFKGCGEMGGVYVSKFKTSARRRNLDFNLDAEYLWNLYIKQGRKCTISGTPLFFSIGNRDYKQYNDGNISLDRIDSSKGYIKGNVQWVVKEINIMKWDLSQESFINLCHNISSYQKSIAEGK